MAELPLTAVGQDFPLLLKCRICFQHHLLKQGACNPPHQVNSATARGGISPSRLANGSPALRELEGSQMPASTSMSHKNASNLKKSLDCLHRTLAMLSAILWANRRDGTKSESPARAARQGRNSPGNSQSMACDYLGCYQQAVTNV